MAVVSLELQKPYIPIHYLPLQSDFRSSCKGVVVGFGSEAYKRTARPVATQQDLP